MNSLRTEERDADPELAEVAQRLRRAGAAAGPALIAPEGRMAQVRRRVRRVRRIRSVLATAPLVALVAVASFLVPGGNSTTGPAASRPLDAVPSGSGAPDAGTSRLRVLVFPSPLPPLQVQAPGNWKFAHPVNAEGVAAGVFLSSEQPAGKGPCGFDNVALVCAPVVQLPKNGVLIYWKVGPRPEKPGSDTGVLPSSVDFGCRHVGGTTSYTRIMPVDARDNEFLSGTACLSTPDQSVVSQVRAALASVHAPNG